MGEGYGIRACPAYAQHTMTVCRGRTATRSLQQHNQPVHSRPSASRHELQTAECRARQSTKRALGFMPSLVQVRQGRPLSPIKPSTPPYSAVQPVLDPSIALHDVRATWDNGSVPQSPVVADWISKLASATLLAALSAGISNLASVPVYMQVHSAQCVASPSRTSHHKPSEAAGRPSKGVVGEGSHEQKITPGRKEGAAPSARGELLPNKSISRPPRSRPAPMSNRVPSRSKACGAT